MCVNWRVPRCMPTVPMASSLRRVRVVVVVGFQDDGGFQGLRVFWNALGASPAAPALLFLEVGSQWSSHSLPVAENLFWPTVTVDLLSLPDFGLFWSYRGPTTIESWDK